MDKDNMSGLTPCERFCKYFAVAREVYCQSHGCEKVSQKTMVDWYNTKYNASLTEVNLSKYLKGINDIPISVYVNMKELAGIEELWLGASTSREDYELSLSVKESLDFIRDELEFMCTNPRLSAICGDSMPAIMHGFIEYCEAAASNDYSLSLRKLAELQNEIIDAENEIVEKKNNSMYAGMEMNKSLNTKSNNNIDREHVNDVCIEECDILISKLHAILKAVSKCIRLHEKRI